MKILGISDGMTGGAALIEDGTLRYAVNEERLLRAKMAIGFPAASIRKTLEDTGTRVEEVDAIAIATINEFFRKEAHAYDGWMQHQQTWPKELLLNVSSVVNQLLGDAPLLKRSYYRIKSLTGRRRRQAITEVLRRERGFRCPIQFIDHHLAHAASAYFTSGMRDATVITMDGAGDNISSRVYTARDGRLHQWNAVDSFNSLGNYYAYITHLCGFKAHHHEGKITGLAAYGEPRYAEILRRFITYEKGRTVNTGRVFYWAALKALKKALPEPFEHKHLASSMQQVLEEVGCAYIRHWLNRTGGRHLALAGGVFANVRLNQRVHELEQVRSVFIHPGMGDEGLAVGAAFAVASTLASASGSGLLPRTLPDVYLGPGYSERQIEEAIQAAGLEADDVPDIERRIAELLAEGAVVARFDGRMEYGPRALGSRSVLYQTTDPTVNDWLNKRLRRTEFMPFAPVTLAAYADQFFVGVDGARDAARFMTITFDCTPWMKRHCPAVVHVDGTARPQLIEERINPSYYRILEEYRRLTGLPSVINTSFNMHEEPIVCSPMDAIRSFQEGGLEYLAMGNVLLANPAAPKR